ncbi:hypothetical protein PTQ56_14255, partial [Klebsiella michiganensis]|nr:hypothetical protein [Klebsiella michiganensis]
GPDPRNFNQRVSLGRNDLLIRTFPNEKIVFFIQLITCYKTYRRHYCALLNGRPDKNAGWHIYP